ncbi:MAG TPA: hypothetical protein VF556_00920 [Pyrinomonadaceae bacterium]|jgi:ribosomal protein L7/L12/DNA-binding beta-propeller fold protein YncE
MPQSFRCDSCSAPIEFAGGKSGFQRCEFCGNQIIVPAEVRQAFASHYNFGGNLIEQSRKLKEIKQLATSGNQIQAVKLYREAFNCGLKEAKDAVDGIVAGKPLIFTDFQTVDPTNYIASSLDAQKLAEAERLIMDGNKIGGISHLRESFGLGLQEAKDVADRLAEGKSVNLQALRASGNQVYSNQQNAGKSGGLSFLTAFFGIIIIAAVTGVVFLAVRPAQKNVEIASPNYSLPEPKISDIFLKDKNGSNENQFANEILKFGGEGLGAGQFDDNRAIAIDSEGRIYSGNYSDGRIQVFDANGKFLTQWSAGEDVYLGNFAADRSGKIFIPTPRGIKVFEGASGKELPPINQGWVAGIAVALDGTLWITTQNNEILHLANDGKKLGAIKNAAQLAGLKNPNFGLIAVDGADNVFVADEDSHFIVKFNSKGEFLSRFGGKKDKFSKETPPGKFDSAPMYGLAVDNKGRVYVSQVSDVSVFDGEGGFLNMFETAQAFGMAFTDKNELWIASRPFVVKYQINAE